MTNTELEKKIEELSAQIEALKGELKKETPKGEIWKPKLGEEYSYIGVFSEVHTVQNVGSDAMEELIECGNVFQGDEKAQFEAQREKYTRLFRQYVEQHSEPLDWEDDGQEKWFVNYDHVDNKIEYLANHALQSINVYGSSEEVMRDAVEFVGRENVLKYILSVEDE